MSHPKPSKRPAPTQDAPAYGAAPWPPPWALGLAEALDHCRARGWPASTLRIREAIRSGELPTLAPPDDGRRRGRGRPRVYVRRRDLDAWLRSGLLAPYAPEGGAA